VVVGKEAAVVETEPGTVFVVEDDVDVRDALTQVLELEGFRVRAAANGREAMDRMRGTPLPSVILLDLMMPVMDGWQFRAEQMRDPRLAKIPVIIISADHSQSDKAALSAAAFLRKPIDVERLLALLRLYC
jgi:CheY-like chemotaxis protein